MRFGVMFILDATEHDGKLVTPEIDIVVNDIALPLWAAIPPRRAAQLALETAEALDARLESLAPKLRDEIYTGGFVYAVKANSDTGFAYLQNAPGYLIDYSYRPRRWLALETGLEQIIRPVGSSMCCEYLTNAMDELYLVPFGAKYVWESKTGRLRLSLGGGGAYVNHDVGHEYPGFGLFRFSGWGVQIAVAADYGPTRSGRFRVGVAGRYYDAWPNVSAPAGFNPPGLDLPARVHLFVGGPVFMFSFH